MNGLSRRAFAASLGGMLIAGDAIARPHRHVSVHTPASRAAVHRWPMGLQLWTVNAEMKTDPVGTLKALKRLGFETVETAGLYGMSAAALRKHIEDAGLTCKSYHSSMGDLVAAPAAHMANAHALGASWLVCASPKTPGPLDPSKPWLDAMYDAMTPDAWKENAGLLARLAETAKAAGLMMTYHNHPMEFRDWGGGVTGFGLLMKAGDLLRFELDIGWVVAGGADPVALLKGCAGRVDLLHVKDMIRDASAPRGWRSVEVGRGVIDWASVFAVAHATGVKGYFIEQEPPYTRPIMQSLAISARAIRGSKSFR